MGVVGGGGMEEHLSVLESARARDDGLVPIATPPLRLPAPIQSAVICG